MRSEEYLQNLGFRAGIKCSGAHTARTMMIEELTILLFGRPELAKYEDYQEDVEVYNILQKPTENSRKYTFKPLTSLYGLSMDIPLFKTFREYWDRNEKAQPILALQLAVARDPYLKLSAEEILRLEPGQLFAKDEMEQWIETHYPEKFSKTSLASLVRNISSTWSQAGYLTGKGKKHREIPQITYVNVAYALFLGHCQGFSGQRLFDSFWCKMLAQNKERLYELAYIASIRGLINFKQASEVVEVTFPSINLPEG